MIQLDDEQYWLYTAVDPNPNDLLHTKLEPTRANVIPDQFFAELREKHELDDAVVLVYDVVPLHWASKNIASILDTNDMEIRTALNVSFVR